MRIATRKDHVELFSNENKLKNVSETKKYLNDNGIRYILQDLSWSETKLQRFQTYENINKKLINDKLHFFVYIKFIKVQNISYAIVCGETTVGRYKGKIRSPLGDLCFTTDKTKGLSKLVINKYKYEWDTDKVVIIPTYSKYDSKRLEAKIIYDLVLMTT